MSYNPKIDVDEIDMLTAVAKAQRVLHEGSLNLLNRDRCDGILAVKWLDAHAKLFAQMIDEAQSAFGFTDAHREEILEHSRFKK